MKYNPIIIELLKDLQRFDLKTVHHELSGRSGDTDLFPDDNGKWVKLSDVKKMIEDFGAAKGLDDLVRATNEVWNV